MQFRERAQHFIKIFLYLLYPLINKKYTTMSKIQEKFNNIIDNIKEEVVDFTTLDVVTLTGNLKSVIKEGEGTESVMSIEEILQQKGDNQGDVKVLAFTRVNLDQDVTQYVMEGLSDEQQKMYELHKATVESSKESRQAFIKFIKEVVTG